MRHPSDQHTLHLQLQCPPIFSPVSLPITPKMSSAPETPVHEQLCPMNMTPPLTPLRPKLARATTSAEVGHLGQDTSSIEESTVEDAKMFPKPSLTPTSEEKLCWEMTVPRHYTGSYQRQGSASSGYQELGHGAWSTVYRATECSQSQPSPLPTPPTSPASSPNKSGIGRQLAIKTAARRDAQTVLYQEARILTYIHSPHASHHLVPFHGYDIASQSLVMDAIPLSLDTYTRSCLQTARLNLSTRTMFDPVCGAQEWQSLATQLIDGLAFLHSHSCVHGDIKPGNVLLRPNGAGSSHAYSALYCDFSSSRIFDNSSKGHDHHSGQGQQLTALTTDFASPELFTSLFSTAAVATMASDVYALGVTLVVAAIGTNPYAGASTEMQKLCMAREGKVLDFARQSQQGTRVMKGKMVERCLKGALEKDVERRSTVVEWKRDLDAVFNNLNGT